jgi:hypothetical protein
LVSGDTVDYRNAVAVYRLVHGPTLCEFFGFLARSSARINESGGQAGLASVKALVVHSRAAKDKPLIVVVKK